MVNYLSNKKVEIDIHYMYHDEAKRYLERYLSMVNGSIRGVVVIHSFASCTVLQQMVPFKLSRKMKFTYTKVMAE
jgi:DNA-nicking Smr family endonuclease